MSVVGNINNRDGRKVRSSNFFHVTVFFHNACNGFESFFFRASPQTGAFISYANELHLQMQLGIDNILHNILHKERTLPSLKDSLFPFCEQKTFCTWLPTSVRSVY